MDDFKVYDRSGYTSVIYCCDDDPSRVCKAFIGDRDKRLFEIEKAVYERFMAHRPPNSILKYYGVHDRIPLGLVLEVAENKSLSEYLWNQREVEQRSIPRSLLYLWACQAARGLQFAHSLGVYNSDIHPINFLLNKDLNLKVADWAGASIDGSRSLSSYRTRYQLVGLDRLDKPGYTGSSVATEIFALGTVIYTMVAGHEPWPELKEPNDKIEIKRRIGNKEFPELDRLPVLSSVILRCWHVDFQLMEEVREAIEAEATSFT